MADKNVIRELLVALGVKVDPQTKRDLKKFDEDIDRVKGDLETFAESARTAGKWLATALVTGTAAAVTAIGTLAVTTGQHAEQIERQARALNLTRAEYQELEHVFATFGVESQDIADGLAQINEKAQDAISGDKGAIAEFALLNLHVSQLKGLRPHQLLELIAQASATAADQGKALAATSKLLGEDVAKKLGPALKGGAQGIRDLRQEAHDLGLVMSDDQLAIGKEVSETWRELKNDAMGLAQQIGIVLGPLVDHYLRLGRDWLRQNRQLLAQRLDFWLHAFARAVEQADKFVQRIGGWDKVLVNLATGAGFLYVIVNLEKVEKTLAGIRAGLALIGVTADGVLASLGLEAAPVAIVLAGIALVLGGLYLTLDDFTTYWQGTGKSVFGTVMDYFDGWRDSIVGVERAVLSYIPGGQALLRLIHSLGGLGPAVVTGLRVLGTFITSEFGPAWAILQVYLAPAYTILDKIRGALEAIKAAGSGAWHAIDALVSSPIDQVTAQVEVDKALAPAYAAAAGARVQAGLVSGVLAPAAAGAAPRLDPRATFQARGGQLGAPIVNSTNNFYSASPIDYAREQAREIRKARDAVQGGPR